MLYVPLDMSSVVNAGDSSEFIGRTREGAGTDLSVRIQLLWCCVAGARKNPRLNRGELAEQAGELEIGLGGIVGSVAIADQQSGPVMLDPIDFSPRPFLESAQNEVRVCLEAHASGREREEFLGMQSDFESALQPVAAETATE